MNRDEWLAVVIAGKVDVDVMDKAMSEAMMRKDYVNAAGIAGALSDKFHSIRNALTMIATEGRG